MRNENSLMVPRISPGDLIVYYRLNRAYESSEVIIFTHNNKDYLGRIIAIPGDIINITDDNKVIINDSILNEEYIYYETYKLDSNITYPITIKDNEYFILSDNRISSLDSRYLGTINIKNIKGKVISLIRKNNL